MESENNDEIKREINKGNSMEIRESYSQMETAKIIKAEESIKIEISNKSLMDLLLKNESKIKISNLEDDEKFIVKLQHVGNAPIMKNNKLNIKSSTNSKLLGIYTFIKDALKTHLKENDTIVY